MNPSFRCRHFASLLFVLAFASLGPSADVISQTANDLVKVDFFEKKIRPILVEHCYECHASASGDNNAELRLDHAIGMKKGGTRGPVISKVNVAESLLLKAIQYDIADLQMPPAGKLPQASIDDIRSWIEQGAVDPRTDAGVAAPPAKSREQAAIQHWSFQPLSIPEPSVKAESDFRIIDLILAERQQSQGLVPNPSASKRELIRRLYYDLLGLQPTWEQYQAWDKEPVENYEAWIDQLLGSPHFGERMARRWMDVARYADTKGYVFQEDRASHALVVMITNLMLSLWQTTTRCMRP